MTVQRYFNDSVLKAMPALAEIAPSVQEQSATAVSVQQV